MAVLYTVALAWIYVVGLMAIAEGTAPQGSWLGAIVTFCFYGVLPLGIAGYLLTAPMRRAKRRRDEAAQGSPAVTSAAADPDGRGHPPGHAVAPVGEEARTVGDDAGVARRNPVGPGDA